MMWINQGFHNGTILLLQYLGNLLGDRLNSNYRNGDMKMHGVWRLLMRDQCHQP